MTISFDDSYNIDFRAYESGRDLDPILSIDKYFIYIIKYQPKVVRQHLKKHLPHRNILISVIT